MHRYLKDAFFFKHGHALPAIPSYFLTNFQAFFLYQYWGFQPGFLVWNRTILGTNVGGWHLGQSSSGSGCAYRRFAAAQMEVATLTLLMEGGEKKKKVCMHASYATLIWVSSPDLAQSCFGEELVSSSNMNFSGGNSSEVKKCRV